MERALYRKVTASSVQSKWRWLPLLAQSKINGFCSLNLNSESENKYSVARSLFENLALYKALLTSLSFSSSLFFAPQTEKYISLDHRN
jgi:hypothetical protein